jgi:hypothetical protein
MAAKGFYVSAVDGSRRALVDGPHAMHSDALARVDAVRARWLELDPRSHFYWWGTASVGVPRCTGADCTCGGADVSHQNERVASDLG